MEQRWGVDALWRTDMILLHDFCFSFSNEQPADEFMSFSNIVVWTMMRRFCNHTTPIPSSFVINLAIEVVLQVIGHFPFSRTRMYCLDVCAKTRRSFGRGALLGLRAQCTTKTNATLSHLRFAWIVLITRYYKQHNLIVCEPSIKRLDGRFESNRINGWLNDDCTRITRTTKPSDTNHRSITHDNAKIR